MSLIIVERVIGGVEKDAIVVRGTAETEEIILVQDLDASDVKQLTAASVTVVPDNETPTLGDRMGVYVTSTGQTAAVRYAKLVNLTDDLNDIAKRAQVSLRTKSVVADLDSRVTALDASVTALDARVVVLEEAT